MLSPKKSIFPGKIDGFIFKVNTIQQTVNLQNPKRERKYRRTVPHLSPYGPHCLCHVLTPKDLCIINLVFQSSLMVVAEVCLVIIIRTIKAGPATALALFNNMSSGACCKNRGPGEFPRHS